MPEPIEIILYAIGAVALVIAVIGAIVFVRAVITERRRRK